MDTEYFADHEIDQLLNVIDNLTINSRVWLNTILGKLSPPVMEIAHFAEVCRGLMLSLITVVGLIENDKTQYDSEWVTSSFERIRDMIQTIGAMLTTLENKVTLSTEEVKIPVDVL
jgi:hypothetical protein